MAITVSFADAAKIILLRHKLFDLRDKAPDDQLANIDSQLARLRPYVQDASDIVMQHTDAEYASAAKVLTQQIKPINDAIADIKKIAAAISTAAQIISDIIKIIGVVSTGT